MEPAAFLSRAHWVGIPQRTVSEEGSGSPGCHNVKTIFISIVNCPCRRSLPLMVQKQQLVRLLGPAQIKGPPTVPCILFRLPLMILKSQFHPRMFLMNSKSYVLFNFDPRYTPFNIRWHQMGSTHKASLWIPTKAACVREKYLWWWEVGAEGASFSGR